MGTTDSEHSSDNYDFPTNSINSTPESSSQQTKPTFRPPEGKNKVHHFFSWLKFKHSQLSKKQKMIVILTILILLGGGGFGSYALYKHFHKPLPSSISKKFKPSTEASHLTGVQVDPALNKRPVTGIIIENSPDARPQSGLNSAGIVFEAVAEGGITRFLALYQEAQPDYIGPVRSVRPYYLDWLMPFDASIAHIGGAPQALSDIKAFGVKDLDQFFNSQAYDRVTTRYAPHNVYTSMAKLDSLNQSKGFISSNFTSLSRKPDSPAPIPTAKTVDINVSNSVLYNSHYDWDGNTNTYKRSEGGAPHIDEKTGAQISPKVVMALVMSRGIASDGQHTEYGTTGSGTVYIFEDGLIKEGTWLKADRKGQFTFKGADGADIKLNAGQTWLTMVDSPSSVAYKP